MKRVNITTPITISLLVVSGVACIIVSSLINVAIAAAIISFVLYLPLGLAIFKYTEGERFWVVQKDGKMLPRLQIKPRGYVRTLGERPPKVSEDETVDVCDSCNTEFDKLENHIRTDHKSYCPDCSKVGKYVMHRHRKWFDDTEDAQQ